MNKSQNEPLVSILMNCYNGEKFLEESISSVVNQTYSNWELVFWDNQSSDKSADIVKQFSDSRIKYFLSPDHTNLGNGRARAWKYLNGEFISILDVDDLWLPEKIEKQLPLFNNSDVGIVISNTKFISNDYAKPLYQKIKPFQGSVFRELIKSYYVSIETLMLRKKFVEILDVAIDNNFNHISDMDLVIRLSYICKLKYIDTILANRRIHEGNASWHFPKAYNEERLLFLDKLINNIPDFEKDYSIEKNVFFRSIKHSQSFIAMMEGKLFLSIKYLFRIRRWNSKTVGLFLLIFIPFRYSLVKKLSSNRVPPLIGLMK